VCVCVCVCVCVERSKYSLIFKKYKTYPNQEIHFLVKLEDRGEDPTRHPDLAQTGMNQFHRIEFT